MQAHTTRQRERPDLHLVSGIFGSGWGPSPRRRIVRLLDADPDLAEGLTPQELLAATRHAVAPLIEVPVGEWKPAPRPEAAPLGALVLRGVVVRQVRVGNRQAAELIGPGEIIRPADADDGLQAPVPYETTWWVVQQAELALLDERFAQVAGRFPSILDRVFGRMAERATSTTVLLAISQLAGLEVRILALLWHLADRFGQVERDGVVIPIRLTHEILSRLAGAQRPSVTTALNRLKRGGHVRRGPGGCWVLPGCPPTEMPSELAAVAPLVVADAPS